MADTGTAESYQADDNSAQPNDGTAGRNNRPAGESSPGTGIAGTGASLEGTKSGQEEADNIDMEWEATIEDIRALYGNSDNSDTVSQGTATKAGPVTPDPTQSDTVRVRKKADAFIKEKREKAMETAKGNLGPQRLVYEANKKARIEALATANLSGGTTTCGVDQFDLYSGADGRAGRATVKCALQNNENASFSFSPETWTCSICQENPNHGLRSQEVIILSDQSYPAIYPGDGDKQCVCIIRLEFGTLAELTNLLIRIGKNKVPAESIILISSAHYLSEVGTAAYAAALNNEARRLRAIFGTKLKIAAAPPSAGARHRLHQSGSLHIRARRLAPTVAQGRTPPDQ